MLKLQQLCHKISSIDLSYYYILNRYRATSISSHCKGDNSFLDWESFDKMMIGVVISNIFIPNLQIYIYTLDIHNHMNGMNCRDTCTFRPILFASMVPPP